MKSARHVKAAQARWANADTYVCENCGGPVLDTGRKPRYGRYCSKNPECRRAQTARRGRETYKKKPRAKNGTCCNCGGPMYLNQAAQEGRGYCGQLECRRKKNRIRMASYAAQKKSEGVDIFAPYRAKSYAKKRARIENGEIPRTPPRSAARIAAEARRRALKAGATVEVFEHVEIYERDGWTCGICGTPVDPALRWPDDGMATIDHIVPLTRGGNHSRANVRCAHLYCNIVKGNKLDAEL